MRGGDRTSRVALRSQKRIFKGFLHNLSLSNPSKIVKIRFSSHLFLNLLKFQEHIGILASDVGTNNRISDPISRILILINANYHTPHISPRSFSRIILINSSLVIPSISVTETLNVFSPY